MVRIPRAEAFEVADGAAGRVVADWERHNAETLIELACRVPSDKPFRAREVNLQLDDVGLALVRGTPHAVQRDEELVAARPADAIAVYAALRGEAMLEYGGARRVVHPGEILVCDVDRPFLRGFGHGLEELAVKVPRAAFADLTGLPELSRPLVLDAAADPYARALVTLVGRAVRARVPVPAEERAVLELVSVIATEGRVGLPIAHRAAARAFIDDHLADPRLSAAEVAAGAGLSERHLSRLFAEAGTSVPRHILGRRLDLAHSILASAADTDVRTVDVAVRCGFTSMSHFSQAFRRRFGITAGQARRQQLR
jgi:AraC-like DNA-binding protein